MLQHLFSIFTFRLLLSIYTHDGLFPNFSWRGRQLSKMDKKGEEAIIKQVFTMYLIHGFLQ